MQWRGRRGSSNIEDRRGMGAAGAGGVGIVGMLAILAVGYFFGIDISPFVQGLDQGQSRQGQPLTEEDQQWGEFVSVVLADTEEVWGPLLPEQAGIDYVDPRLVLFSGVVQSACGGASSAMGPFYCPGDQRLYLDTDFFDMMASRMGAGGDFAYAYVIAHEVGHHVQNLTGTLAEVNRLRSQVSESDANQISVLTELQADCYAGLWARRNAGTGRSGGSDGCGTGRGRRRDSVERRPDPGSRQLYPRQRGAASGMADARLQFGRHGPMRYVPGSGAVTPQDRRKTMLTIMMILTIGLGAAALRQHRAQPVRARVR
jgi:predicted metalloprotease